MSSTEPEVASHRACSHCRSQKVRCIPSTDDPDVCQRCVRARRPCIFAPVQKRKQRKRTDTRVAELEREMRVMRAMLKNKDTDLPAAPVAVAVPAERQAYATPDSVSPPNTTSVVAEPSTLTQAEVGKAGFGQGATAAAAQPATCIPNGDVVDRGVVSIELARELLEAYRADYYAIFPMVRISPSTSADELRISHPTLFLAIMSSAAGRGHPELAALLDQEVLQTYALKTMVQSEKSLELVQALLISAVWYNPPAKFSQLKYYEYVHMAVTMAMDIGIGNRPVPPRPHFGVSAQSPRSHPTTIHHLEDATNPDLSLTPRTSGSGPEVDSIESRRTFVSCFVMCTGVSMSLRRPNMLRVTTYLKECVDYLENSPQAVPSDHVLAAIGRLIMLADEITSSLAYDDPADTASIADLRTQLMIHDYKKRLDEQFFSISPAARGPMANVLHYSARLYLFEVALHVDHSPEDFKAPYQMGPLQPWTGDPIPTHVLSEAVAECIFSAHSLLAAFRAIPEEHARGLPVLSFVRIGFAAFILAKLCVSVSNSSSQISRVLDHQSLDVENQLDQTILHVKAIVGPEKCRIPATFLALLFKLRQWCMNPKLIGTPTDSMLESSLKTLQRQEALAQGSEGSKASTLTSETSSPQSSNENTYAGASVATTTGWAAGMDPLQGFNTIPTQYGLGNTDLLASTATPESSIGLADTSISSFLDPRDQMQLDVNFFDFFRDPNLGMTDMTGNFFVLPESLPDDYSWAKNFTDEQTAMP